LISQIYFVMEKMVESQFEVASLYMSACKYLINSHL
jgi:hypothetical protein